MEKSVVVVLDLRTALKDRGEASAEALAELNAYLAEGWRVKHSCGMGGTDHYLSACLVVLERDA